MYRRDKSYKEPIPDLSFRNDNGWKQDADGKLSPVRCLVKPAPLAVLENVRVRAEGKSNWRCASAWTAET